MGIELTTEIVGGQVDLRLVEEDKDLKVRGRLEELHASDGTVGNQTSTVAGLRAPRDLLMLGFTNSRGTSRGSPEAPICTKKVRNAERRRIIRHDIPSGPLMKAV